VIVFLLLLILFAILFPGGARALLGLERRKDAFKTHRANRGDARNSR
jgi:hypothetical protein